MIRFVLLLFCVAGPAMADTIVAAHTVRAKSILAPSDLAQIPDRVTGGISDPSALVGQEARVTLYVGRPIRMGDVGPPALIERNQIVTIDYTNGAIAIQTDGRALDRAGLGDRLRVMNLQSRATIIGTVTGTGRVSVEGALR